MNTSPAYSAKNPANSLPAGVTGGFTGPMPPSSIAVLRKPSSGPRFSKPQYPAMPSPTENEISATAIIAWLMMRRAKRGRLTGLSDFTSYMRGSSVAEIARDGLQCRQGREPGRFGAQDARAEAASDETVRARVLVLVVRGAALGPDQQHERLAPRARREGGHRFGAV